MRLAGGLDRSRFEIFIITSYHAFFALDLKERTINVNHGSRTFELILPSYTALRIDYRDGCASLRNPYYRCMTE